MMGFSWAIAIFMVVVLEGKLIFFIAQSGRNAFEASSKDAS
jgi:uncharacterized protein YjeT (DUF2065 family)